MPVSEKARIREARDGSTWAVKRDGVTWTLRRSCDTWTAGNGKERANGFTLVDADSVVTSTTTATDDTVELDHVFTASGSQSVSGFAIENDDDDVVFAECCFDAAIAMENLDTLTVEMKMQFKLGA